jgi:hypothetical protein
VSCSAPVELLQEPHRPHAGAIQQVFCHCGPTMAPDLVRQVSGLSRRFGTLPAPAGVKKDHPHGLALTTMPRVTSDRYRYDRGSDGFGSPYELVQIASMIRFAVHLALPGYLSSPEMS